VAEAVKAIPSLQFPGNGTQTPPLFSADVELPIISVGTKVVLIAHKKQTDDVTAVPARYYDDGGAQYQLDPEVFQPAQAFDTPAPQAYEPDFAANEPSYVEFEQLTGQATQVLVVGLRMKPGLQTAHNVVDIVALHDASSLSQSKQFAAVQATQAIGTAVALTT